MWKSQTWDKWSLVPLANIGCSLTSSPTVLLIGQREAHESIFTL